MRRSARGVISDLEVAYTKALLEGPDAAARKHALQRLCKRLREEYRLRDPRPLRLLARSLLYDPEPKVVRWSLNALAFLGEEPEVVAIIDAIDRNRLDPDILASGVAALAALTSQERLREELDARELPLQGATLLAAAQKLPELKVNLVRDRVNIDRASIPELRLASILVGIDKAPENMFSGDHANADIIGKLNKHPDSIVAQYSIWALTENSQLGLDQLQIALSDVAAQRENIRAYIYQLVAEDVGTARKNFDFLVQASEDDSLEGRQHLARGLKETYFDGLEELTVSWLLDEENVTVKTYLLEHMAAQAAYMTSYGNYVIQAYKEEGSQSALRLTLEAATRGTDLGGALHRIRYASETSELFGSGAQMTITNNNNFNAPITAGVVTGSGDAHAGDTYIDQREAVQRAVKTLGQLRSVLHENPDADLGKLKEEIEIAIADPSKDRVGTVQGVLNAAISAGKLASSAIGVASNISDQLGQLSQFLP